MKENEEMWVRGVRRERERVGGGGEEIGYGAGL